METTIEKLKELVGKKVYLDMNYNSETNNVSFNTGGNLKRNSRSFSIALSNWGFVSFNEDNVISIDGNTIFLK